MAMLMTNRVFAKTWGGRTGREPAQEFWPTVIGKLHARHPLSRRVASVGETGVGAGLLVPVTGFDGQSQRGGVLGAGLLGLPRGVQRFTDAVERLCLTVAVARLAEEGEGLPQLAGRPLVAGLPQVNDAQVGQCGQSGRIMTPARAVCGTRCYLRMLTARARTRTTVTIDTADCSSMAVFAHRDSGMTSVGLNAAALVNDRYR